MSSVSNNLIQNQQNPQTSHATQQVQQNLFSTNANSSVIVNDSMTPLDDPQYLLQNAYCFQLVRELSQVPLKQKSKKNEIFQFTNQFLYGIYMPPSYSVLNFSLMEKLVSHLKNPHCPPAKLLMMYNELIDQERELFDQWLSSIWEENLKNRRLNVIPHVEEYIKSAYNFLNSYIKLHYNGTYTSKIKIDYNREECEMEYIVEIVHCQRVKISDMLCTIHLPKVDIKDVESKLSFKDCVYNPPQKSPFINDELCQTLMKEHDSYISMCLSSVKHIMSLEKPNSVWLIPVNINNDTNNRKMVFIGGALSTGHFSQQEKSLYYLRKELKRQFRELVVDKTNSEKQNYSKYNYDKWKLNVNEINGTVKKSFNILIRNKPHIRTLSKSNHKQPESVFMPKVEYQPEFGFEKLCDEQVMEYWLDTHFRNPKTKLTLVSVQYNMDIMMVKNHFNIENYSQDFENIKQMRLQRLYMTLEKLLQLDKGEYVLLHKPKRPFEVEVYQLSKYGGFNLLNMYYVLQQSDVSNTLAWNSIDSKMICPIHDHFKVAPCMFRPNPVALDMPTIHAQVTKFKTVLETQEKFEKERMANKKRIKKEKNRVKQKLKRENDNLYQMKRKALN